MTISIFRLSPTERQALRDVVLLCVAYWPNAHLGDDTPRQDIHRAFGRIRMAMATGMDFWAALGRLETDAYRHADM